MFLSSNKVESLSRVQIYSLIREIAFSNLQLYQWKKKHFKYLKTYLTKNYQDIKLPSDNFDMKFVLNKFLNIELCQSEPVSQLLVQSIFNEIDVFKSNTEESFNFINSEFFSLLPIKSNVQNEITEAEINFKLVNKRILEEISVKRIIVLLLLFADSVKRAICNDQIYLISKYFLWTLDILNDKVLEWINSNGGWMKTFVKNDQSKHCLIKWPPIGLLFVSTITGLGYYRYFPKLSFVKHFHILSFPFKFNKLICGIVSLLPC
uniref:Bax-2 n=1 Tax=Schmidtea mediterranea TaxID=79327 RepID=H2DL16_SCHMD|nr:bax-2 [Schmidtea mediterranea]